MKLIATAVLLAVPSAFVAADDKIGNAKAPESLKKVRLEMSKRDGYHVTEKITLPKFRPRERP